jgi:cyanate permease
MRIPPAVLMLALAWLIYFYFGIMAFSLAPILTTLESQLHFGNAAGGVLLGAYPLAYVVAALKVGQLCDRFGVKRSVVAGVLMIAASALFRALAQNFWQLFLASLLLGVGGPVVSTVLPKLVAEWFHGTRRTIASGIYVTGPNLGGAVALGLTIWFISVLGSWRHVYLAYAGLGVAAMVIWSVLAVSAPGTEQPRQADARAEQAGRPIWRSPAVWYVVLAGIASFVMTQGFVAWLPTILTEQGFTAGQAALWAGISRGGTVAGNVVITFLVARLLGPRRGVRRDVVVAILVICGLCILACTPGYRQLTVAAVIVQSTLAGAMLPLLVAILLDLPGLTARQTATAAGLYFTVGQIGAAASPVIVGWLRDLTGGFTVGLVVVAACSLATVAPAMRMTDQGSQVAGLPPPASEAETVSS